MPVAIVPAAVWAYRGLTVATAGLEAYNAAAAAANSAAQAASNTSGNGDNCATTQHLNQVYDSLSMSMGGIGLSYQSIADTTTQIREILFDVFYKDYPQLDTQMGKADYTIKQVFDQLLGTTQAVIANRNELRKYVQGLRRYSLDPAGLSLFRSDKAAGRITGSGLICSYQSPSQSEPPVPVLNPELLTVESPSGDTAIPTFELIADELSALRPWTP